MKSEIAKAKFLKATEAGDLPTKAVLRTLAAIDELIDERSLKIIDSLVPGKTWAEVGAYLLHIYEPVEDEDDRGDATWDD